MKRIKAIGSCIDWPLLLLLTVVANQAALWLKFAGLLSVFILRADFKKLWQKNRLPLFVPLIMLLGIVNYLLVSRDFTGPATAAFCVSMVFWAAAFAGTHQVKLSVERNPQKILHTLKFFTWLNVLVSLGQIAVIAWSQGVWNPYHQLPFPYGMSTGDWVMGIFGEGAYNNAFVSALLSIYFLFRKEWGYLALSIMLVLLIFGNAILLSLILLLLLIWIFALLAKGLRKVKPDLLRQVPSSVARASLIAALLLSAMIVLVSPDNVTYVMAVADSGKDAEEIVNEKETPPSVNQYLWHQVSELDFKKYQNKDCRDDNSDIGKRKSMTSYAVRHLNGKKLSFMETYAYVTSGVRPLVFGAGPARFSSLTAARFSGLDSSRLFRRVLPQFTTCAYAENHRLIHTTRISGDPAWLSTTNWPNSFYNQLFGEYGLSGVLFFLIFYVWRYLRHASRLSYGLWISLLMLPIAALTYLVEPLCVLFFYELLMEQDIADNHKTPSL